MEGREGRKIEFRKSRITPDKRKNNEGYPWLEGEEPKDFPVITKIRFSSYSNRNKVRLKHDIQGLCFQKTKGNKSV